MELVRTRSNAFPSQTAGWLESNNVLVLNVAGNRESTQQGIGARVEAFLGRVFKISALHGP
jgi:Circularly permutated YpsA SLOG family